MKNLARALLGKSYRDPHQVDDAVQDTWVAVLEHPDAEVRNPRAWLAGILKNVVRQGKRTESRRLAREERSAGRDPESPAEEIVERADLHGRVVKAVLDLEEPWRSTLLMRFFDDLSAQKIAKRLGIPASTVRSRLHAALGKLRAALDRESGGDRRAWSVGLATLAWPGTAITTTTGLTATGALTMTFKTLTAAALALGIGFGATHAYKEIRGTETEPAAFVEAAGLDVSTPGRTDITPAAQDQEDKRKPVEKLLPIVQGRVVDRTGEPVAGARVFIGGQPSPFPKPTAGVRLFYPEERERDGAPTGAPGEVYREREMWELGEWRQLEAERLRRHGGILGEIVTTDGEGRYEKRLPDPVADEEGEKQRVYVTVLRDIGLHPTATGAWHDAPAQKVDFTMDVIPTALLSIYVTDLTTQKRLVNVSADLFRGERAVAEWMSKEPVREQEVELPPGETNRFTLRIWSPEWARTTHDFTVQAGDKIPVEVLVSSGAGFTGRVVDTAGNPIEGAYVYWGEELALRKRSHFNAYETSNVRDGVRTDAAGFFTLPGTAKRVSAWHAQYSAASALLADAETLVLPERGGIEGVLLDENGLPAAGRQVTLDRKQRVLTDENGAFAFEDVEAGMHGVGHWPERFCGVLVAPGETVEIPPVEYVLRPTVPVTSGGAPLHREDGGIVVGLDPVFTVNEWGFEGEEIHTGHVRPGRLLMMSRRGFLTTVELPEALDVPLEVGTASLTLELPETDLPSVFVLPESASSNPIALYWGQRLFGEREGRRPLKVSPLRAGRYAVIVAGRGVVHTVELQDGEARTLPPAEWLPADDVVR